MGELKKLGARQLQFQYLSAWLEDPNAFALSISLPLRPQPFENAQPFFANLLPEGEVHSLLCKKLGLSDKNDFGLLAEVGGDIEVKFGLVQKELEKLLALVEKHGVILEAYPALKEVVNHNRNSLIQKLKASAVGVFLNGLANDSEKRW